MPRFLYAGVRVVRNEPGPEADEIHFRLDTFDAEEGPIRELVISCVLDEDAAAPAAELIRTWVSVRARAEPARAV